MLTGKLVEVCTDACKLLVKGLKTDKFSGLLTVHGSLEPSNESMETMSETDGISQARFQELRWL